jgi:hypothetical protein
MLEEWIEIGKILRERMGELERCFFLENNTPTPLFKVFLGQLQGVRSMERIERFLQGEIKKRERCVICGKEGARPITRYIFPLIIAANKFPNLYPQGSEKHGFYICGECAIKSLSAYIGCFWYADRINNRFLLIFFYSKEEELLRTFLNRVLSDRALVEFGNSSNLSFLNRLGELEKLSFPFEFTFRVLYEIIRRLEEFQIARENIEKFFDTLKLFVLRIDNAFGKKQRSKQIFKEFTVLFLGSKFLSFIKDLLREEEKRKSFLRQLYFYTRKYDTYQREEKKGEKKKKGKNFQTDLIVREEFFKHVMKGIKVPGEIIEELLIYNLLKNDSKDKPKNYKPIFAPIIFRFLKIYYKHYIMEEKKILEIAVNEGKTLGEKLLNVENDCDKVKGYIYELRRKRNISDFMENLNYFQLRAGHNFSQDFLNLSIEKRNSFKEWKAYFLIGMANAVCEKCKDTISFSSQQTSP